MWPQSYTKPFVWLTWINDVLRCLTHCGPSDAIRWQGTESTLAQVMACCLTAPSHYLNQYWLIISEVLWHSSESITMRRSEDTNQKNKIENYIFRIAFRSPWGQWVKLYDMIVLILEWYLIIRGQQRDLWINWFSRCQLIAAHWCHMALEILVNIVFGNGMVPAGTKALPDPLLTYHQ